MLRGSQKRMIVVRTRDSRLFEEAYFVIRRSADEHGGDADDEWDMLREANRILESSMAGVRRESFPAAASPRYDLSGRRITTPQNGQVFIQNGQKFIWGK